MVVLLWLEADSRAKYARPARAKLLDVLHLCAQEAIMANTPPDTAAAPEIEFSYLKSAQHRVIFAEGAFGGVSPRGMVQFSLYSERAPIPRRTSVTLNEANEIATPERVVDVRDGMVREVEATVMMPLDTAIAFREWLDDKIRQIAQFNAGVG